MISIFFVSPVLTAVHEHVILPRGGVEVAVDGDAVVVLQQLGDQHLDVVHGGVGFLHRVFILPVEVSSRQVTPRIAHNDPIRVYHGDNLEYVMFSQSYGDVCVACKT